MADGTIKAGDKEVVLCPVCGGVVPPSKGFKPRKYCCISCTREANHPRAVRPKSCTACGKELHGLQGRGRPRLICDECRNRRRTRGEPKAFSAECIRCGKRFTTCYKKKFCSDDCRYYKAKVRKGALVSCKQCGKDFAQGSWQKLYCSKECKSDAARTGVRDPRPCLRCGKQFRPGPHRNSGKFCSRECAFSAVREGHPKAREPGVARGGGRGIKARCEYYGAPYVPISRLQIFKHFSWTCQICGCKLLPSQARTEDGRIDPRSPTVDHIIPVSLGSDSPGHAWGNVQAACRECNVAKGATLPSDSVAAG